MNNMNNMNNMKDFFKKIQQTGENKFNIIVLFILFSTADKIISSSSFIRSSPYSLFVVRLDTCINLP